MKKLLLLTLCLVGGTALFAQDKRHNFEVAYEVSDYEYREPHMENTMSLGGVKQGVSVSYLRRSVRSAELNEQDRSFASVEFRYMTGDVDYDGSVCNWGSGVCWPNKSNNLTDYYFELALKTGWAFKLAQPLELWPYLGVGWRYLRNHLEEGGNAGYLRTSTYVYMPLGLQLKYQAADSLKFSLSGEFDWLLSGQQYSDIPFTGGITNDQTQGYGVRAGLRADWALSSWASMFVEPFWRYWHVQNSEEVYLRMGGNLYAMREPFNTTREYGVRVGFVF